MKRIFQERCMNDYTQRSIQGRSKLDQTEFDDDTQHQEETTITTRRKKLTHEKITKKDEITNRGVPYRSKYLKSFTLNPESKAIKSKIQALESFDKKFQLSRNFDPFNNKQKQEIQNIEERMRHKRNKKNLQFSKNSLTHSLKQEISLSPSRKKSLTRSIYSKKSSEKQNSFKENFPKIKPKISKLGKPPKSKTPTSTTIPDIQEDVTIESKKRNGFQSAEMYSNNEISSISVNMMSYQEDSSIIDLKLDDKISHDVSKMNFSVENSCDLNQISFQDFTRRKEIFRLEGKSPSPILSTKNHGNRSKTSNIKKKVCFVDEIMKGKSPSKISKINDVPFGNFILRKPQVLLSERLMTRFRNIRPIFKSRKKAKYWIKEVKDSTNLNCNKYKIDRDLVKSRVDDMSRYGDKESVVSGVSSRKKFNRRKSARSIASRGRRRKSITSRLSSGSRIKINLKIGKEKKETIERNKKSSLLSPNKEIRGSFHTRFEGDKTRMRCSKSVSELNMIDSFGKTQPVQRLNKKKIRRDRKALNSEVNFYAGGSEKKEMKACTMNNFLPSDYSHKKKGRNCNFRQRKNEKMKSLMVKGLNQGPTSFHGEDEKRLSFKFKLRENEFQLKDSLSQISLNSAIKAQKEEENANLVQKFREIRKSLKEGSKNLKFDGSVKVVKLEENFESFKGFHKSEKKINVEKNLGKNLLRKSDYQGVNVNMNNKGIDQLFKLYTGGKSRSKIDIISRGSFADSQPDILHSVRGMRANGSDFDETFNNRRRNFFDNFF